MKKVGRKPNPDNSRELWLQFINADSEPTALPTNRSEKYIRRADYGKI